MAKCGHPDCEVALGLTATDLGPLCGLHLEHAKDIIRGEQRLIDAETRIAELEAKLAAKWISVEERLPEDQQEVLIVVPSINLHTKAERQDVFHANFWEESKTMASCEEGDFEDGEYTHWQLLPDPPVQP